MSTVITPGDLEYCRQLVCEPGGQFYVSHRFSKSGIRDKLLIYRAFVHELGTIPYRVSDPAVAMAKLAWWHNELKPGMVEKTEHPVARAMKRSGNLASINDGMLDGYLSSLLRLSSGEALTSVQELENSAEQIGGAEAVMEAGLVDASSNPDGTKLLGAGAFISRLVYQPGTMFCAQSWWLPLDTRARHAVNVAKAEDFVESENMLAAMQEMSGMAAALLVQGKNEILESKKRSELTAGEHHLLIEAEISLRRLEHLISGRSALTAHKSAGPREVYFAWREAIRR